MPSSKPKKCSRPHWAACRKPDIRHDGRQIWRVPHDRERFLLEYWYSETGPVGGEEFDVRDLPGWVDVGRFDAETDLAAAWARHTEKEQAAHAAVIRACIDAGVDMLAVSRQAQAARDEERRARQEVAIGAAR